MSKDAVFIDDLSPSQDDSFSDDTDDKVTSKDSNLEKILTLHMRLPQVTLISHTIDEEHKHVAELMEDLDSDDSETEIGLMPLRRL